VTSEGALRILLELSVQATVILALASVVLRILARRSAALRHSILSLALGSLFVLPLVPAWLPAPAWLVPDLVRRSDAGESTSAAPRGSSGEPAVAGGEVGGRVSPVASDPAAGSLASDWPQERIELAIGLWILVAALLLSREVAGRVGAALLTRSAREIAAGKLAIEVQELAHRLRIRRRVTLCSTDEVASPASIGLLSPRIFVPADAELWPANRRRVALLHELAHVARKDDLVQFVGRIARAAFWFHPLVWWTLREQRRVAEEACDDVVIREHGDPCGYAEELLGFAQRQNGVSPAVVCFMASSNDLERRVASILDPTRSRQALPRAASIGTLLFTAISVVAIGSFGRSATQEVRGEPTTATVETSREALADWLASQRADESVASASDGLDRRWRRAAEFAGGRSWIGWSIDVGLEETTIFKRDVVVSDLPVLVHPTTLSLLVVVELSTSRDGIVRILQVQASNAPRVLQLRGAPFRWLGAAREGESRSLLLELQARTSGEARSVLLSLLGLHARGDSGGGAVELLERVALESTDPLEAEGALTGLSFLPTSQAGTCLARVAARARQPEAQDRAREMLHELGPRSAKDAR
jgi:beta-lactamase regulating signal transducer with metallopeptidase domain